MNEPFRVALMRGIYSAVITGGIALLTTYQVAGGWTDAMIVGGITALTTLAARTGVEGIVDTRASRTP